MGNSPLSINKRHLDYTDSPYLPKIAVRWPTRLDIRGPINKRNQIVNVIIKLIIKTNIIKLIIIKFVIL